MQKKRFLSHRLLTVIVLSICTALAALSLGAAASGAPQSAVSAQVPQAPETTVNLAPTVDTYVTESSPAANYNGEAFMWVAHDEFQLEQFILLRFDLSSIPAGGVINSASLQLAMFDGGSSSQTLSVCRATSSWSGAVTWNSRPGLSTCSYGSSLIPTGPENVYYSWNITTLVSQWYSGVHTNYGLAVREPAGVYMQKGFRTNDYGSLQPRLVVDYTLPTDPPTATPSPTSSPGSIGDRVWHDANHNGVLDPGESGINNVGLSLVQGGVVVQDTTTNSSGFYTFSGVAPGDYSVHVDPWSVPGSYVLTHGSNPWNVTLGPGENRLNIDFGYAVPATPTPTSTPVQDLIAYGLEVTQGIQNLPHDVRLVEDKRTFVRFYARTATECCSVPSYAFLHLQSGSDETWVLPLNPGLQYNVFRYMPRSMSNGSFLFELPSGWREGTVTITAHLNPGPPLWPFGQLPETTYANNTTSRTVTFEPVPTLNLHIYNVGYQAGGVSYMSDTSHSDQLVDWLRRAYPVSNVRARYEFLLFLGEADVEDGAITDPDCDRVNSAMSPFVSWVRSMAPSNSVSRLYGIVDDGGGFMRGCAEGIPGTRSSGPTGPGTWGWDTDGSYGDWYGGHEIAHNMGRLHAEFCGAGGGGHYPYPGGRIGPELPFSSDPFRRLYGFDTSTQRIYPDSWRDVMTYCINQWISDYTYEGIMSYMQGHASLTAAAPVGEAANLLLVSGSIDPHSGGDGVRLDPLFVLPDTHAVEPRVPGDYAIVLRGDGGQLLARYAFTPTVLHSGPPAPGESAPEVDLLSIFEMVPYVAGTDIVQIEGPGGDVLHTVTAGGAAPTATIVSPQGGVLLGAAPATVSWTASDADGDPLAFLVQFSPDAGTTWKTVGLPTTENSLEVPIANVVNSADARFRVLASDGIHTTEVVSSPFSVPNRAPTVSIQTPSTGHTMHISQTLGLQASAYDYDLGMMDGAQLAWSSNIDGALGTGAQLSLSGLSVGVHTITVEANDGEGGSDADTVQITVVDDPGDLPAPDNALLAGPDLIVFDPWYGRMAETLYVGNLAPTTIGWNATADASWLALSAASGQTPDALTVSVDDPDLPPGLHTATITLSSPHSATDVEIVVQIHVREDHVHLPFFARR